MQLNRKLRVLILTEASYLNTGYSIYARELLTRLHSIPNIEVAELAAYAHENDPKINTVKWLLICNAPNSNNADEMARYDSNPINRFGLFKFDDACIYFKPDIVISYRDYWMDSFVDMSPFRKFFKWIWMVTADANTQNNEWLDVYSRCDMVLAYNNWSGRVISTEGGGKINYVGEAPPAPSQLYQPIKTNIKEELGISSDTIIFGTVMRNQKRKLFPDLFKSFSEFINTTKAKNTMLYCHTSYPEGWNLAELIKRYQLSSKLLMTYVCRNPKCRYIFPSFFFESGQACIKCGELSALVSSVSEGPDTKTMCNIYNLFDYYIQYANSEGFGIPMVEAAACGIPVIAMDYSAMSDVGKRLGAFMVKPLTVSKEIETGCDRAISNDAELVKILTSAYKLYGTEHYKKLKQQTKLNCDYHFNWNKTVNKWLECFNKIPILDEQRTWYGPPNIHEPEPYSNMNITNNDFAKWLITKVLHESEKLNTYLEIRLTRDLNMGRTINMGYDHLSSESSYASVNNQYVPFNRETAYKYMKNLRDKYNYYENKRVSEINKGRPKS